MTPVLPPRHCVSTRSALNCRSQLRCSRRRPASPAVRGGGPKEGRAGGGGPTSGLSRSGFTRLTFGFGSNVATDTVQRDIRRHSCTHTGSYGVIRGSYGVIRGHTGSYGVIRVIRGASDL
eukprot:2935389-Pyramimonas_sp.AAC.3